MAKTVTLSWDNQIIDKNDYFKQRPNFVGSEFDDEAEQEFLKDLHNYTKIKIECSNAYKYLPLLSHYENIKTLVYIHWCTNIEIVQFLQTNKWVENFYFMDMLHSKNLFVENVELFNKFKILKIPKEFLTKKIMRQLRVDHLKLYGYYWSSYHPYLVEILDCNKFVKTLSLPNNEDLFQPFDGNNFEDVQIKNPLALIIDYSFIKQNLLKNRWKSNRNTILNVFIGLSSKETNIYHLTWILEHLIDEHPYNIISSLELLKDQSQLELFPTFTFKRKRHCPTQISKNSVLKYVPHKFQKTVY